MKKTLLILLLFITSTAQAERRTVKVVDRAPPRKALTDIGGHLLVEHSGIKNDIGGHLQIEHTRAMTNSKRRSQATDDLDRMLDAMLREAQWEKQLEQMYHEFFGGRGDFPTQEKYEWSSGDTDDVDPTDNDDYIVTITDQ